MSLRITVAGLFSFKPLESSLESLSSPSEVAHAIRPQVLLTRLSYDQEGALDSGTGRSLSMGFEPVVLIIDDGPNDLIDVLGGAIADQLLDS